MKLGHWLKFQKLHMYSPSTPGCRNWADFCSTGSGFWDTGQFSQLPYMGMKLCHWKNSSSCTYIVFLPHGVESEPIFALRASASTIIAIFGHATLSHSQKCQKLYKYSLSTLWGRNWAYFCSTDKGFQDTGWFSKLLYLGMKLGHWPKFQKLDMYSLPTHVGRNWIIFALWTAVSEIRADCQNCHIWAWNLALGQSATSCTYTLFLLQGGGNWAYFCSIGSSFWDKDRFSKLPYLGIKLWPKFQKHIYPLSTARGRKWAYFRSTGSGFRDTGRISKLPFWGM